MGSVAEPAGWSSQQLRQLWQHIEDAGVLTKIVGHLSAGALNRAAGTRRSWYEATRSDDAWRAVCERQAGRWPILALLKARPGNTLTWRDLYIQQHLSASTLSGREPPQLRPDRPDRTRFLLAFEMVLPVDADVDLEMPDRQQQLRDCEREWAVLHASLQELSSSPGTATPGGEHETMLLAHMPTIEGSLAHEWGQASGHNYLEGKSPFFCNRGQPEVRMALIRKADGKSLPLAAIEHQDGCYMYTRSPTGSADDILEELDFEGYFSGFRKFPFQLNQRRIATDVGVSIKYHAAGCQHCGALDGLRVYPVAIDPADDPFKAFIPPLKCVQCNQENMRAEHQKVRVASVDISIEDREEEDDDRTIYIKSVDALLEVVDSPHCAHLWV